MKKQVYLQTYGWRMDGRVFPYPRPEIVQFDGVHLTSRRPQIEKQTDVNIAIKLIRAGLEDIFDTAVIISGDTDLIPAVQEVQRLFPTKQIGFVFPMGRVSNEIRQIANFTMRLSERHVSTCQFPDTIQLSGSVILERPDNWR